MIHLKIGNLLTADAPAIGHGVNTEGVMGAGIARKIRAAYPDHYRTYRERCLRGEMRGGDAEIFVLPGDDRPILVNLATQEKRGPNARLEWVEQSLTAAAAGLAEWGVDRLAIPMIGCGIGGLGADDVLDSIERVEFDTGFSFEVYRLPLRRPAGSRGGRTRVPR